MENSSSELLNIMSSEVHLWVAVRRHWRVAAVVAGLVFGVIAYKTFRAPGIYKSEALIVVGNQVGVSIIQDTSNREAKDFAKELPTEIEILQSPSLLNKAISQLRSNYGDIHIQDVQSNLSLNQPKDTNVLSVSYQDVDRVRAKNILDKIVATIYNIVKKADVHHLPTRYALLKKDCPMLNPL
ncbi:MAG: hypothetical protein N5P05_000068 [Chroococcopsis gigantea SAG 12.99]|nr:hypothetical protein [Chroococcopsis gigantea SAG 12.99]